MAAATDGNRREPYIGEKRKFLRDGFGTYVFENAFFRYEGEWMKGKKHGHGKLLMKDGTYYEGQFINGEINGNGYKYFSSSKAKYTGQFLNGEMHGHGIMTYLNGNVYEGQWYKNKKQGFGILRTSDKSVYEGTFHGHVRDGEGTQTYDPTYIKLSNGDRYEGYWVLDQRNGHGDLWCADGSHYSGNFVSDLFHGLGVMTHASGVVYRGDWINGLPITMATKIVLIMEEEKSPVIIRQGQPFNVKVECRNDEDELVEDQGRELQVIAGFKYRQPKQGSALFDMIEDVEDQPIQTPYYDVVPYPLTDQLGEVAVPVTEDDSKMSTMVKDDEVEDKGEDENDEDGQPDEPAGAEGGGAGKEAADDLEAVAASMAALVAGGDDNASATAEAVGAVEAELAAMQDGSRPATPGDSGAEDVPEPPSNKAEEVTPLLPPLPSKPTKNGLCEWTNLQLAPPPPMYRPFVIMEEEAGPKKKSKAAQIREKIDTAEGEDEAQVAEDGADTKTEEEGKVEGEVEQTIDVAQEETKELTKSQVQLEAEKTKMDSNTLASASKEVAVVPSENGTDSSEKKNAGNMNAKSNSEIEKPVVSDEKIARTGEYVLLVQDVTSPPFMGRRLQPAFLLMKLKKPKKIIVKKPNSQDDLAEGGEEESAGEGGEFEGEDENFEGKDKKAESPTSDV